MCIHVFRVDDNDNPAICRRVGRQIDGKSGSKDKEDAPKVTNFAMDLFVKTMKYLVEWNFLRMLCSLNLRHFLEDKSKLVQVSSLLVPKVLDDVGSILILGHPV